MVVGAETHSARRDASSPMWRVRPPRRRAAGADVVRRRARYISIRSLIYMRAGRSSGVSTVHFPQDRAGTPCSPGADPWGRLPSNGFCAFRISRRRAHAWHSKRFRRSTVHVHHGRSECVAGRNPDDLMRGCWRNPVCDSAISRNVQHLRIEVRLQMWYMPPLDRPVWSLPLGRPLGTRMPARNIIGNIWGERWVELLRNTCAIRRRGLLAQHGEFRWLPRARRISLRIPFCRAIRCPKTF